MPAKKTKKAGGVRKRTLFKMEIHPAFMLHTGRSTVTLRENGVTDVSLSFAVDGTWFQPLQIARRTYIAKQEAKELCRELVKSLKKGLSAPDDRVVLDGMDVRGTIVVPRGAPLSFSFQSPDPGSGKHCFLERTLAFVEAKFQDAEVKTYLGEVKGYF